ncbi:hypothetical protein NQZ68_022535 [Dissostichus eleginoides]|nr:hypothetical protein NQZ68_022535 [Dissostichus eleginoides]
MGGYQVSLDSFKILEDQIPHGFPTIDMGPQLKVVERTRTATMLCAASGNPDPEIFWFKDFLPVDISSTNGRIKQLRSAINSLDAGPAGSEGKGIGREKITEKDKALLAEASEPPNIGSVVNLLYILSHEAYYSCLEKAKWENFMCKVAMMF